MEQFDLEWTLRKALKQRQMTTDHGEYLIDIVFTSEAQNFNLLPANLGPGSVGVAIAFSKLVSDSFVDCVLDQPTSLEGKTKTNGFITGVGGLFVLAHNFKDRHKTAALNNTLRNADPIKNFEHALYTSQNLYFSLDLFDGLAGFIFGLTGYADDNMIDAHFSSLEKFTYLCSSAFENTERHGMPYAGLAHGRSGLCLALDAIWRRTASEQARSLSEVLMAQDHATLIEESDTDPRFVDATSDHHKVSFCNGAVGLATHQAFRSFVGLSSKTIGIGDLVEDHLGPSFCHGAPSVFCAANSGHLVLATNSCLDRAWDAIHEQTTSLVKGQKSFVTQMAWNNGALSLFSEYLRKFDKSYPSLFDLFANPPQLESSSFTNNL